MILHCNIFISWCSMKVIVQNQIFHTAHTACAIKYWEQSSQAPASSLIPPIHSQNEIQLFSQNFRIIILINITLLPLYALSLSSRYLVYHTQVFKEEIGCRRVAMAGSVDVVRKHCKWIDRWDSFVIDSCHIINMIWLSYFGGVEGMVGKAHTISQPYRKITDVCWWNMGHRTTMPAER